MEEARDLIQLYLDEKKRVLEEFPIDETVEAANLVWNTYLRGGTVYGCGNGGNAAYVSNLLTDLSMHPFVSDDKSKPMAHGVKRLKTSHLVDSGATLTAILNDIGPGQIFSQQLINDGVRRYDLVFGFTGSGNSGNVLEAFKVAKEYGATTVAITRGKGGKAKGLADLCIVIPGDSKFPGQIGGNNNNFHYEDALSSIAHMITGIMRQRVTDLYSNGR